jgi:hypothetical protein
VEDITDKLTLVLVGHKTRQETGATARFLCFCEDTTRQKASTRKTVSDLCPGEDLWLEKQARHDKRAKTSDKKD